MTSFALKTALSYWKEIILKFDRSDFAFSDVFLCTRNVNLNIF